MTWRGFLGLVVASVWISQGCGRTDFGGDPWNSTGTTSVTSTHGSSADSTPNEGELTSEEWTEWETSEDSWETSEGDWTTEWTEWTSDETDTWQTTDITSDTTSSDSTTDNEVACTGDMSGDLLLLRTQTDIWRNRGCTYVAGGLELSPCLHAGEKGDCDEFNPDDPIVDLSPLANLRSISGRLRLHGLKHLRTTDGLESLVNVESLLVNETHRLEDLNGLANVKGKLISLSLTNNRQLRDLKGLNHIVEIEVLTVHNEQGIKILDAFNGLKKVVSVMITNNPNMERITGFAELDEVTTSWNVAHQPELLSVSADHGTVSAWGKVLFSNNPKLASIRLGIPPSLGSVTIQECPSLRDWEQLDSVQKLNGLRIESSYDGYLSFRKLAEVTASVIVRNTGVNGLDLSKLRSNTNIEIENNPVLSTITVAGPAGAKSSLTVNENPSLNRIYMIDEDGSYYYSELNILNNGELSTINWPGLAGVGQLWIEGNPQLITIQFDELLGVDESFMIALNQLSELTVPKMVFIGSNLAVVDEPNIRLLNFDRLASASGTITIQGLPNLLQFNAPELDGENLAVVLNDLQRLHTVGLNGLSESSASLILVDLPAMNQITLPQWQVGRSLSLSNTGLGDLSAFAQMTQLTSLTIQKNPNLTDEVAQEFADQREINMVTIGGNGQ